MFQGPRTPIHRGMPSHPYMNQMPVRPSMGPMPVRPSMGPMMRGGPPQMRGGGYPPMRGGSPRPMRRGGGGLLAKILGRGNQAGIPRGGLPASGLPTASRAAAASVGNTGGGGILKTLSNPTAINGFLSNTQKVLSTAQQYGPMVQQYGPMLKNIPAMWKLYRGIKDSSDEDTTEDVTENKDRPTSIKRKVKEKSNNTEIQIEQTASQPTKRKETGSSVPKLYI